MKKRIIYSILPVWVPVFAGLTLGLASCQKEATAEAEAKGHADEHGHAHDGAADHHGDGAEIDPVELTAEQYANGKFALGKLEALNVGNAIHVNGIVDVPPENLAKVGPIWEGFVREMVLLEGQRVSKGQVLFTLENPEFVEMQQSFLEAKGSLAYLKADYEIQQKLATENIAAQKTYLKAESEYLNTKARFEALRKKLTLIGIAPGAVSPENLRTTISVTAPIGGYVTEIHATRGQFIHPDEVAVGIANTDHIHLELGVFERDVPKLKEKQPIKFHLPESPDQEYDAFIHLIGRTVDPSKRTVNVHAHLKDEGQSPLFTPGMYVEATILADGPSTGTSSNRKCLPEAAVVRVDNGFAVLVRKPAKNGGYLFDPVMVKVGGTQNGKTEILNPEVIPAGAEILVEGGFSLMGGMMPHLH